MLPESSSELIFRLCMIE